MITRRTARSGRFANRQRQSGMVMWVALAVLIIMTLAGLAMLRQMGGGVSIAGNLAFKQSATSMADLGTETARAWLVTPGRVLISDVAASGYYSTWGGSIDPTTWTAAWSAAPSTTDGATGNTVRYVIHRLCERPDLDANAAGQRCSAAGMRNPDRGSPGSSFTTISQPYYRITTQVTGPRNTVSYIQVVAN